MKKLFGFVLVTCALLSMVAMTSFERQAVYAAEEEDVFVLTTLRPYLFVDKDEPLDLTKIAFNSTMGEVLLSDGVISNLPDNLLVSGTTMTAASKDIHRFAFTIGDETINIYVFAKLPEETSYTIYSKSFSELPDGDIPSDYSIVKGSAGIENGYLYLDSPATATPTQVTLPDYLKGFKNYQIETDFSILSAVEPTRWASLMYRFSPDNYFQMCIRQNATANNGVEFAKAINGQWNVPITTAFTEAIDSTKIYRLKVDLFGSTVREYINDTLLITYEAANDYKNGLIGFQSSGSKAIFNNIVVTMPEDYIDNNTVDYSGIPDLYVPESNVITPPAAVKMIDSMEDIEALANTVRPQTVVFRLNSNLDVTQANGVPIISVTEIFDYVNGQVIPAFYTKNHDVAVAIASLLESYSVRDVFIISPNDDAIIGARDTYNMIRGVFEVPYDAANPTLDEAELIAIRDAANATDSIVVKLPIQYATKDNVFFLQERLVSVWVDTDELSTNDVLQGLVSGANGLVVSDETTLYDLFMQFPVNTLLRRPITIGHRGLPTQAPENSLPSMQLAMDAGADVVELDIYLTTDNEVVVIHDSTTTRTANIGLVVEESTLAQLRALELSDTFGIEETMQIPTMNEYFERIQGTNTILFIEIKSSKPEIITRLAELIEEYDVSGQIVAISFNATQLRNLRAACPGISIGYLSTALLNKDNLDSSIRATLNAVVPIGTTVNPEYSQLTYEYVVQMNYRGLTVWPWTYSDSGDFWDFYLKGVGGLTTNYANITETQFTQFKMNQLEYSYDLYNPSNIALRGKIESLGGLQYNYVPSVSVFDDGGTGIVIDELANVTSATTEGVAVLLSSFTTNLPNGEEVTIVSDLVYVSVIDTTPEEPVDPEPEEPVDPEPEQPTDPTDDSNPLGWIIGGITGGTAIIAGAIFVGIRFFKKPRI
ncbi:MAG: glycerophosphodiester phosphodiesterase family protein [Candidatus Izemoplasmatales bacterium]|nr:glycerophosphodiester phosphodiesterase family protein [Candidatus Izemoplasmatales bacterium]